MRNVFRSLKITMGLSLLMSSGLAWATPQGLTLQGRLLKDGQPVENTVDVTIKITSIAVATVKPECVLYEETHTVNLANSDGIMTVKIGGGTRTANDEGLSLVQVFTNNGVAIPNLACTGSPSSTSYTPASGESRNVYITFQDGTDTVAFSSPYVIQSVPYALEAERLAGKSSSDFLQVTANTTQTKLNDIMVPAKYTELLALLDGTSSSFSSAANFTPTAAVNFNGQNIVNSTGLSLSGSSDRSIAMERQTTANTAGNDLTVAASGATSGATDKAGGDLVLSSGTSTGSGASKIELQTSGGGSAGTSDSAPTTKLTILGDGNVGIGTTSPTRTLDVNGLSIFRDDMTIQSSDNGGAIELWRNNSTVSTGDQLGAINFGDDDGAVSAVTAFKIEASQNHSAPAKGTNLHFYTTPNNSTTAQARLTVLENGFVGIGTTSPTSNLEVNGTIRTSGGYGAGTAILQNMADADNNWSRLLFGHGVAYDSVNNVYDLSMNVLYDRAALEFTNGGHIVFITDAADRTGAPTLTPANWNNLIRMIITADGEVGIGTDNPSEALHVVGNLRVQGSTDCTLGNGAGGTNCSSDIRLKENVRPIENALEKIQQLKGVEFDWNWRSLSYGRHDIGVIAQDVEKVFPTSVIEDPSTGYKKVDYASLVSPLIQATKELHGMCQARDEQVTQIQRATQFNSREIASIKAENFAIRLENARISAENAAMKGKVAHLEQENAALQKRLELIEKKLGLQQ